MAFIVYPQLAGAQLASSLQPGEAANFDIRLHNPTAVTGLAGKNAPQLKQNAQADAVSAARAITTLKAKVPDLDVSLSDMTASAEVVRSSRSLTPAAPGRSAVDIVRSFLRENSELYGLNDDEISQLHFIGESVSPGSGLRMVRVEQMVNGRPVFQSESRFILDREGRLIRSVGLMVRDAAASASPLDGLISAPSALESAMNSVGIQVKAADMTMTNLAADGHKAEIAATDSHIAGKVPSEIVYFALAPGVLVPAWSQVTFTSGSADWYTIVDAKTGTILWRKNIRANASSQEARFNVYTQADGRTPADNPAPHSPTDVAPGSGTQFPGIARTTINMLTVQDATASPDGWIPDDGTTTTGNNVDAYLDRVSGSGETNVPDTGALDNNGRPIGNPDAASRNRDFLGNTPRDFVTNFLPPPQGGDPESGQTATGAPSAALDSFRRGVVTHLFYLANWYHDQLYNLGFDEAAGNFQQTNFSGTGNGGDRVLAEAQDASGTDNANFSTPPDGTSGRMQMYRFIGADIDRDGSLDAEVVLHELTHGLSNRLIGNGAGLTWSVGGGMGEGWSDFYALSLLNNTNADDPNGKYAEGGYATYKLGGLTDNYLYGIRRFPYSTDKTVNPLTWADVDDVTNDLSGGIAPSPLDFNSNGALEVHSVGEVWALTLWEVRSRVIADPAGANGDVPTGNHTMLQLVTDALKMTPLNPSFTDARDAILDADAATNSAANEQWIWAGFAKRGLGYNAVAPLGHMGFSGFGHISIGESFDVPYLDVESVAIDDSSGNGNNAIDPGEPVKITVRLKNPWRSASKDVASATATLTCSTAGVSIVDGNSAYPAIAAQASANGDKFSFTVPSNATAGQALNFTITATSSLGTHAVRFTLRVGKANGTGAPITYTRTPSSPIAIPDSSRRGVSDTLVITDDLEIADINFRVDNIQHTFTGDLTVLLRAPNGYGGDLIWLRDELFTGGGGGANFINTVIDDQASNDLNQANSSSAPFTGSWLPAFNSPVWNLFGKAAISPDPTGQLSRLNGTSTKGNWKVLVADNLGGGTGTLVAWSLIVTPRAFTIQPLTTPVISSALTATAINGQSFSYQIVASNNPTSYDATGLPSGLTINKSTGLIAGTPSATGSFDIGLSAANGSGTGTATLSLTVNPPPPVISSALTATGTKGQSFSYQIVASNSPTSYDATGLPNGLTINKSTGLIAGTPSATGSSNIGLSAGNAGGTGTATLSLTVNPPPPVISSALTATATKGAPFNYQIVASNSPTSYDATGLPSGLTINTSTGSIAGTPSATGSFNVGLSAGNAGGTGTATLSLTINPPPPVISSALTATATAGQAFSYQIVATNSATSYNATGLPGGLTIDKSTGLISGTPANTGSSNVGLSAANAGGTGTAILSLTVNPSPPVISSPPSATATVGQAFSYQIVASNSPTSYDARGLPNGLSINTATGLISGTPTDPESVDVSLSAINAGGTGAATLSLTINAAPVLLGNISTRLSVGKGDNVLIGGFIITGTQPKKLIVRAIGPSLEANGLPVPGRLENPALELYQQGNPVPIARNDNWVDAANKQEIIDSTIAPTNDFESAILTQLDPGSYTAIVRGVADTTGVGLVEVYDLDQTVDSKLAQISTRGFVQTGDDVMIGGLYVIGSGSEKVIVRAIGPSLPVDGKLLDPTLELRDGNGVLIDSNDNWRSDHEADIVATTVPPSDNAESAIVQTLSPGPYTAIVRGVNDTTGVALVEVYGLN